MTQHQQAKTVKPVKISMRPWLNRLAESRRAKEAQSPQNLVYHPAKNLTPVSISDLQKQVISPFFEQIDYKLSVYFCYLPTGEAISKRNFSEQLYPASLAKLFLLGTTYQAIEDGKLSMDAELADLTNRMITWSDSQAFNLIMEMLSHDSQRQDAFRQIESFCQKYQFDDTFVGSTYILTDQYNQVIDDTIYYYRQGGTISTAKDIGHFLNNVYYGKLVSLPASVEILDLLLKQERNYKLPAGLPEDIVSANKTGEWDELQHDAALVFSPNGDYTLVVMTESEDPGQSIADIVHLSSLIYEFINTPPQPNRQISARFAVEPSFLYTD